MRFTPVELDELRVTVLVENAVMMMPGLRGLHGLSLLVETRREDRTANILFDVGADPQVLLGNMECLGLSPKDIDCIVLSHNHWDHARGLPEVISAIGGTVPVVMHPAATRLTYYDRPHIRVTSNFRGDVGAIEAAGGVLFPVSEPVEVAEGLFTAGAVERVTGEPTGVAAKVLRDDATWAEDKADDDLPLLAKVKGYGLVVLTGCSHAGIANIVRHALKLTGEDRIGALIGGFHLINAKPERVAWTIGELETAGVAMVASGHCTGFDAEAALRQAFGVKYRHLMVGERFCFPDSS